MMKRSKTVLNKRKTLMSIFIATMIIVVSIPAVVSDPPETNELTGPVSPESVIPTNAPPGFRYDPNEYIDVTGEGLACAKVNWIYGGKGSRNDDPECDSVLFDAEYPLYKYGPNVHSYGEFIFGHAEGAIDCGDSSASLSADATMGPGYTIYANILEIGFSAGTLSTSIAEGYDSGCLAGGAGASEYFDRPLHVVFPFFVSESGILFIEKAGLSLDGGASGYADGGHFSGWSYDCEVNAFWEVRKVGGDVIATDTYSLSDFGADDYDGLREIPLPAGAYIFSASYDSYLHGGISVRGIINNPATASVNALFRDLFNVVLVYLPE